MRKLLTILTILFLLVGCSNVKDTKTIAKSSNSVVYIEVFKDDKPIASGSGFIVDHKIVTNYHVIDGSNKAQVITGDNKRYEVKNVLAYEKLQDIAVLETNIENKGLILGNSDIVEKGDKIVAIGSPLGLQNTVTEGIISNVIQSKRLTGYKDIQISASIAHGSSGGALFNDKGEIIGMTFGGMDVGNINFAIPINEVKVLLNKNNKMSLVDIDKKENAFSAKDLRLNLTPLTYNTIENAPLSFDFINITEEDNAVKVEMYMWEYSYNNMKTLFNSRSAAVEMNKWLDEILALCKKYSKGRNVEVNFYAHKELIATRKSP